ncbi:unnamed protein product [Dovyalis caffra]|uniref:Seryl-tRNA synthetase n=1 Tax=Dovyalis caffra TaxID=77055 RepID=A0AAV1RLN7_9ROSI|nr:unnamed protein product [Dovyalis caffra]
MSFLTAKEDATEAIKDTEETKKLIADEEKEVQEAKDALYSRLSTIGNLVHDSVPFDNNEDNNAVIRAWGEKRVEKKLRNHGDLVELLGIADLKKGADVAGGRGFYLKVDGVRLNQALINFGLELLEKRGYTALQTPFFMRKDAMAKCAQLAQFDEELYKEEKKIKTLIEATLTNLEKATQFIKHSANAVAIMLHLH